MINKLILGTVQLGLDYGINNQIGKPSTDKAFEILNTAFNEGISMLDTAETYGTSQELIGDFHRKHPDRSFKIISKLASKEALPPKGLLNHIKKNLEVLHVEKLYGYMFHNYESFKTQTHLYNELIKAKEDNLVNKAGISLYTNEQIEHVLLHYPDFDFIQIPFNIFDNALKRKNFIMKAKSRHIEIHTRSVFLQGLFFMDSKKLPINLNNLSSYLEALNVIKKKHKLDTETLALQYVLQKKYIDRVLIGVDTVEQLLKNIEIANSVKVIPHNVIDNINIKESDLLNPSNWN